MNKVKNQSFPIYFFNSDQQNDSKVYNDYVKFTYGVQLIHKKSYFKLDFATDKYIVQLIIFIIKDNNDNQCHIWREQKVLLMNAEKISFRFNNLLILINLQSSNSLNEELFSFLIDNVYLCLFQCLQRLKQKSIFSIELNNILKNMLMQKKCIRHCEQLIKFIFFKCNNTVKNKKKAYIYLSQFEDYIVYTENLSIQTYIPTLFLNKEDSFDKFIHQNSKCFKLEFIEIEEYIQYITEKRMKEQQLSEDNIQYLFQEQLKGKVKSIIFNESPQLESDQLFQFKLDGYASQLFQVIVALNNCQFSEKFLQNVTLCLNQNHKSIKNLFKSRLFHSQIPQISKEIYQSAFEVLCTTDS